MTPEERKRIADRWARARISSTGAVHVPERDDPRADVEALLRALEGTVAPVLSVSGPPEAFGLPATGGELAESVVTAVDREAGTITLAASTPEQIAAHNASALEWREKRAAKPKRKRGGR